MTFMYYEERVPREPICPNCGAMMHEEGEVMGVMILRCPFCGEWIER